MDCFQGGFERIPKGVKCVVDIVTKVLMDRSVHPPYLSDDLTDVGVDTCRSLVGAAGDFFLQIVKSRAPGTVASYPRP